MSAITRTLAATLAAVAMSAGALGADPIAPDDVVYDEYGGVAESLSGAPGDAVNGREVFSSRSQGNCISCHSVSEMLEDVQWHGTIAPSLDGVGDRWIEADLRGVIANAKNIYPDTMMPAFYKSSGFIRPGVRFTMQPAEEPLEPILSAQQVEDLVAYLLTLTE